MGKEQKKTYVLDTTVVLYDPDVFFKTGEADWVIPLAVIREIDGLKNSDKDLVAKAARQLARTLDRLGSYGDLVKGVRLPTGRTLRVLAEYKRIDVLSSDADNKIVGLALLLKEAGEEVTLFTTDTNMRSTARILGLTAEYSPFFDIASTNREEKREGGAEMRSHTTTSAGRGRQSSILRAFNKYLLPIKVKIALFFFVSLFGIYYYYSRDTQLSFLIALLGVVMVWFVRGLVAGKIHLPISYAGQDAKGNDIWIFRR